MSSIECEEFLEVLLEFAAEGILDLALRAVGEVFKSLRNAGPVIASVGYTLLGVLAGGLRTDPKLDELREEPEFQELLKLAGLDASPVRAVLRSLES